MPLSMYALLSLSSSSSLPLPPRPLSSTLTSHRASLAGSGAGDSPLVGWAQQQHSGMTGSGWTQMWYREHLHIFSPVSSPVVYRLLLVSPHDILLVLFPHGKCCVLCGGAPKSIELRSFGEECGDDGWSGEGLPAHWRFQSHLLQVWEGPYWWVYCEREGGIQCSIDRNDFLI